MLQTSFKERGLKCAAVLFFLSLFTSSGFCQTATTHYDSITIAIAPDYDKVGKGHRFWLGEGYRKLWAAPVKMKVFYLNKEKGGLKVLQRGGGLQTKSLRLRDASGKEWVLRTIQKYPERGLPPKLRNTVARDILQDQVVTAHPYAALTVPPFANALGIRHLNPTIVFIPNDPALGEYQSDFANSVMLFEEREPDDTTNTDNTEKAQRKLLEDNDTRIDQRTVLRARLLDIWMGDWDRHEDQWRWEKRKDKEGTAYYPVPRDRDKVYYNTSGVFPWILSHQWLKSNLQGFHEGIRDIKTYNFNNRYFDRFFLNQLSEDDWKKEISYVQSKMTDDLIERSIKLLPDTIYKLSGKKIIHLLKARRAILLREGLEYFHFLSRYVDVPLSDKHEQAEINCNSDGSVDVTVYKIKRDRTKDKVIYQRTFKPAYTKEVRIYGMGGTDVFTINGATLSPIKVRMIGGDDVDSFFVDRNRTTKERLYVYDRSDQQNILPVSGAKIRTSADSAVNKFDNRSFKFDHFAPAGSILYNFDQGLLFRLGLVYEKHGFRREPYAGRHRLFGHYSTGRGSFMFTYQADLRRAVGKNDLNINILSRGPQNVSTFFGIGNETTFNYDDREAITFFRNKYNYINADVRLSRNLNKNFRLHGGVAGQYYTAAQENNNGRFLSKFHDINPSQNVFSERVFAGLVAGFEINTREEGAMPVKGYYWDTEINWMQQLNSDKVSYSKIASDFSFSVPVIDSVLMITNRVGGGTTFGKPAFFQQMQLGGPQNLRGYYAFRFTGRSMVYHNIEMRLKLFDFTSYLFPGTLGLVAFNDVGRVWVPNEKSNIWHDGYGGGIYLVPADLILVQAVIGHSKEKTQPYFSIGFRF